VGAGVVGAGPEVVAEELVGATLEILVGMVVLPDAEALEPVPLLEDVAEPPPRISAYTPPATKTTTITRALTAIITTFLYITIM
jgi:hypothetical protein